MVKYQITNKLSRYKSICDISKYYCNTNIRQAWICNVLEGDLDYCTLLQLGEYDLTS